MGGILKLARLQIVLILLFTFFKFIRPYVLNTNPSEWIKITLLSLPNFFEAFIGTLILTGVGLYVKLRLLKKKQVKTSIIYAIASVLAGIYVITQELKIHNLGGDNVYDKNDVIFSIIGLIVGYFTVVRMKPTTD